MNKIKDLKIIFFTFVGVMAAANVSYSDKDVEINLKSLRSSDPFLYMRKSLDKGDRRFLGIRGYSISVPGIIDGEINSIVILHGIKIIRETTDYVRNNSQKEFNTYAVNFASRYNRVLLKEILKKPDVKTMNLLKQISKEMRMLEKSDPILESKRRIWRGKPLFVSVAGEGIPGIPENDSVISGDSIMTTAENYSLKSNMLLLNGKDKIRFKNIIKNYVIPYNKNLYRLLSRKMRFHEK